MITTGGVKTKTRKKNVYVDATQVYDGLYRLQTEMRKQVREYLKNACKELERYMKSNHKWQNRTGDAERYLGATVVERKEKKWRQDSNEVVGVQLSHGVAYGQYLEYAMEQRFAIIEPTIRLKSPDIIRGMEGIMNDFDFKI